MRAARPAPLTLLASALASLVMVGVLFALYVLPAYAQDGSEPAKPTGLTGTATHGQVVLTWDDPQDDSITGYVILRRVRENDQGGEFNVLAADTGSAATTYTDDTVAASTAYTYRIRAINEHGASERSGWFHIDTSPEPEPVNSPATGAPTINGTAQVGETLTANTSGIADADGLDDVSFTYQWLADDSEIAGATNATYTLGDADEGKVIKVRVSFADNAGNAESLTSAATETVAAEEPGRSPANPTGPDVGGPGDSGQGTVYTFEDGDRTIRVILQGDLVVRETGADTPSDGVVRRTDGGNIVRRQSGQGGADLPVFRSASGGALMTLPGGVLLALEPDWDGARVNGFFARNNISKTRISELDYIPNGFFVRTEPGFPSLELANALAAQKGVLLSSPNWWREVGTRQDPEETKGDERGAAKEARRIEPRNAGFDVAYDLPLDGSYTAQQTFINPAKDVDYFKLDLSGQIGTTDVRIYTTGEFDTIGELYDSERNPLMLGNDSFGSPNFSLLASLSPDVYYVLVAGKGLFDNSFTDTGSYTLHSETVTATSSVSLGSSVAVSIGAAGEVGYFKLDLSGQTGDTDVSLFTLSDDLALGMEATPFESWLRRWNQDALGDERWITYLGYGSLSPGSHLFAVWSPDGDTGDYSLRAATVPDHGSTMAAATELSLDAPTSGKLTPASDADYFELVLTEAKNLVIMALAYHGVDVVMLNSGGTEIPVNEEIAPRDHKIIDDFAPGTYYVKITAPGASSSSPVHYALYAYEDTGYGEWSGDCADATNGLGISTINDPLYACQWHLNSADSAGMDINVESVWTDGITGAGVNVAVVDATIDHSHADLRANINSALNHDYGGRSNTYRPVDHHGTYVAGVLAARDNTIGVRGVASRATIYGYNLLGDDETLFSLNNARDAMSRNREVTAVSNNSWSIGGVPGFVKGSGFWEWAIDGGVTQGYGGKGVFYVFAGGNGHEEGSSSNYNEVSNYYGVTAVCAVGADDTRAEYSEQGANLWVCAPSQGGYEDDTADDRAIGTTENSNRYTNTFNGTSAATPIVSGVAALLRQVNPALTWRDLKLILATSARQNDPGNTGWENGARKYGATDDSDVYHFNHEYGFGMVDAAAAVALARSWSLLPPFLDDSEQSSTLNTTIPDNNTSGITHSLTLDTDVEFTEFVEVEANIDHSRGRHLQIELESPDGTVSTLAVPFQTTASYNPGTFRFGSAKHLGEDPNGAWKLRVSDRISGDEGTLQSWSIKVYGHSELAVSAVSTGRTTATATVGLHNPDSESLTVHLRYSDDTGVTWSTPAMQTTTGTSVNFPLTGLAPNAEYVLEASLDSTFSDGNEVTANFVNRPANRDIDTRAAVGNTNPVGPWSDGSTIWVTDVINDKLYAYTLATGAWDEDKDIYIAAGNTVPVGLWSDGTTIWVVNDGDGSENKIYAYALATGARDSDNDIDTLYAAGNINPWGLWSDRTTIWVANYPSNNSDDKLYAYTLATGVRDSDKDIDILVQNDVGGLWSDGTTIWVTDDINDKLYAYTLATGVRDSEKDIDTLAAAGNTRPWGLWSDDTTIWVADVDDDKLYAYYIEVSARTPVNTPPDLVVDTPTVTNSNPATGTTFTLSATVRNQGGSTAAGTTLTYYRSTNATIATNDPSVGTDAVRTLNAEDTSAESISVTAPSSAGTYYYGACVDSVTNESNTTNNCSTAVTVAAAPQQPNTSLSPSSSDPYAPAATVVYTVTFEGQWDAAATPGGVPRGAHFSRLIGAVHNSRATFLRSGEAASDGVESMAEEGGWRSLRDEVDNAGTNALNVLTGDTDNIGPTTSEALTVTVTADHPRVTLLTMIAPSPDWFVGVSGLTLLDDQGDWVESLEVDLYPWDAGTEDGGEFSLSNSATSPQGVITNIRGTGKFSNARIATLTFTRQSVNPGPTGTATFIGEQRVGEVLRVDTSSIDDPNGFTNRDFSFTWLADDDLKELGAFLRGLGIVNAYEIAPYDFGMTIKVQIHFADDLGNREVIVLPAPSAVAAAAPDQPRNLSAFPGGPGELNLSWSTPAVCDFTLEFGCWLTLDRMFNVGDGGSDITGYTVQWKLSPGDWGRASDVSEAEITETSHTITGLVSSNTYTVRVRAENVAGLGTPSTEVTVSGASLNVGPVVSGRANPYFFEDNPRDVTTYTATDPESDGITWSLSGDDASFFSIANGVLNFDSAGDFEDPQDVGGNNAYDLNILASDGQNTATFPVTVVIRDVEDERPMITGDHALTFAEGTDTTTVLQTYSATDPEGVNTSFTWSLYGTDSGDFEISAAGALTFKNVPDFDSPADADGDNVYNFQVRAQDATKTAGRDVTVTVTNVNEPPEIAGATTIDDYDENGTGIVATYTAADPEGDSTITWTLGGTDRGDFDITGGVLTFKSAPDYERPADSGRNNGYSIQIRANDGSLTGTKNVTVTVRDVNEEPTIAGDAALSYPENTATTRVLDRYRATDPEGRQITWSVAGTDEDSFRIDGSGNLFFVDQPDYDAPSDSGGDNEYNIQVVAEDDGNLGDGTPSLLGTLSSSFDVIVTVTPVNEPPTVHGEDHLTIFENDDLIASYWASDPEGVGSTFTWSVTGTDRGDFVIDEQGDLRFRNTPDFERPADSNGDNVYVFTVRATDEDGLIGSLEVTATVWDFDEPPTITGSATPPDFPENGVRPVATYRATDPEGRTITWGLAGTDSDAFDIDQGALTFKNIPDFEEPADSGGDNVYNVTVQARDDSIPPNAATLQVTVTVINSAGAEEPSITTSQPSLTLQENGTGTIYTFRARDPQGRPVDWRLAGDDASNFTISGGALTFTNPPDFERPTDANRDNVYELTVVVTDDQGLTDSFDFTVTVTNHHENREPAITTGPSSGLSYQKLNYQENRTATVHTYRARNHGPGLISWTLTGTDSSFFDISPQGGALTFRSVPNYEAPGSSGNDNDYEITVVASNPGGYSDRLNVVITITDVNEGPEISRAGSTPGSVPENQDRLQVLAQYTATDPEGGTVSRWRTSGSDGGDFVISEQGELRFRNTPDYERPADSNGDNVYVFTVQVSDGRNYGSFDETVTVNDVNEPPTITTTSSSATMLRQNENATSRLYTYRATDPEGADTVAWSVGGVDARFFTITERGEFSFKEDSPPDYEQPGDSDRNNVYNVVVQATDDDNNTAPLDVTVTVRAVNEGPEVTSGSSSFIIDENQDLPNAVYAGFDPEGGTADRGR